MFWIACEILKLVKALLDLVLAVLRLVEHKRKGRVPKPEKAKETHRVN